MRVGEDAVEKLAKVLGIDLDEARHSAGYSSRFSSPPETLQDVLERLARMGIDVQLKEEDLRNAPPEILGEVQDSIIFSINYILHKHGLK